MNLKNLTLSVLLSLQGSWVLANQCSNIFERSQPSVSINGKEYVNVELGKLIASFKDPIKTIQLIDEQRNEVYLGVSAKEHYESFLEMYVSLFENRLIDQVEGIEQNLRNALMDAKNVKDVKEIYTQYFLEENGLKNIENDAIIHFPLNARKVPGIKALLNPDGTLQDLQIGPISKGLYVLRLESANSNKEAIFMVKE